MMSTTLFLIARFSIRSELLPTPLPGQLAGYVKVDLEGS